SSVGVRPASAGKKILDFSRASSGEARASSGEAGFSGSQDKEVLDLDNTSRTPDGGADQEKADNTSPDPPRLASRDVNQYPLTDSIAPERPNMNHAAMV